MIPKQRVAQTLPIITHQSNIVNDESLRLAIVIWAVESHFNSQAVSPAGAIGLGQLMLATARGFDASVTKRDLLDPVRNAELSLQLINKLLTTYSANDILVLVAYNAGPRHAARLRRMQSIPRETSAYVAKVTYLLREHCQ